MTTRRAIVAPGSLTAGSFALPEGAAHHARDVLRLRAGDALELLDGAGTIARAQITSVERRAVRCEITAIERAPPPSGPQITLFQAIGKGDKLETVIRMTTELGVARIVPLITARTVAERGGKRERYEAIVEDALRVSGRSYAPTLEPARALSDALARPRAELSIAFDGAGAQPLSELARPAGTIELVVGPEGGFDDEERALIERAGFVRASLGPYTLRTETAGCAVVAAMMLR